MGKQRGVLSQLAQQGRGWLRTADQNEDWLVLQLYLSALLGILGRTVYDAYVQGGPLTLSAMRIVASAILLTAVFVPIYQRVRQRVKRLSPTMRVFMGFQVGFVTDSVVDTLLLIPLQIPSA